MAVRIIGYKEALARLKGGEEIHWIGGIHPTAYFNLNETVRYDTFYKLWEDGHIANYGFPQLHGKVKYKE